MNFINILNTNLFDKGYKLFISKDMSSIHKYNGIIKDTVSRLEASGTYPNPKEIKDLTDIVIESNDYPVEIKALNHYFKNRINDSEFEQIFSYLLEKGYSFSVLYQEDGSHKHGLFNEIYYNEKVFNKYSLNTLNKRQIETILKLINNIIEYNIEKDNQYDDYLVNIEEYDIYIIRKILDNYTSRFSVNNINYKFRWLFLLTEFFSTEEKTIELLSVYTSNRVIIYYFFHVLYSEQFANHYDEINNIMYKNFKFIFDGNRKEYIEPVIKMIKDSPNNLMSKFNKDILNLLEEHDIHIETNSVSEDITHDVTNNYIDRDNIVKIYS